jgi:hypothetical protein
LDVTETDMLDALGYPYDQDVDIDGYKYTYFYEDDRSGKVAATYYFLPKKVFLKALNYQQKKKHLYPKSWKRKI